jgi:hypothetical protein
MQVHRQMSAIHMSTENPPPNPPAPRRVSRWTPPPGSAAPRPVSRWTPPPSPRNNPYRLVFRLVGIPVVAVAAVLLYRGLQARFFLPECDSDRAKQTLEQGLKLGSVRYAQIKTVSSSKTEIVCNAVMPLPNGGNMVVDYSFYWQGSEAHVRIAIQRQPAKGSWLDPRFRQKGRFDVSSRA